jgi:hypothetical protein
VTALSRARENLAQALRFVPRDQVERVQHRVVVAQIEHFIDSHKEAA